MKKLLKDKQKADKVVNYIKDKTEDRKLRENTSMELYEKLQSPITSKLDKIEQAIENTDLYERLVNQNLLSLEPPLGIDLPTVINSLTSIQAIEDKKQKTFTVNIFKGINKDVISKYNIPTSYNSKDEIENTLDNIIEPTLKDIKKRKTELTRYNKRLTKELKGKNIKKDIKDKYDKLLEINREEHVNITKEQNEIKKLKDNLLSYKNVIVGTGVSHQMKRQSYKLTPDGKYGDLNIDLNQLTGFNKLVVKKDGNIIINQDIDDDFIELITKRYNSKKTYSKQSTDLFNKLTKLSGLPLHKTSSKFKKIINCSCDNQTIEYYNDPNELLNELEIIIGSLKSGNTSHML